MVKTTTYVFVILISHRNYSGGRLHAHEPSTSKFSRSMYVHIHICTYVRTEDEGRHGDQDHTYILMHIRSVIECTGWPLHSSAQPLRMATASIHIIGFPKMLSATVQYCRCLHRTITKFLVKGWVRHFCYCMTSHHCMTPLCTHTVMWHLDSHYKSTVIRSPTTTKVSAGRKCRRGGAKSSPEPLMFIT